VSDCGSLVVRGVRESLLARLVLGQPSTMGGGEEDIYMRELLGLAGFALAYAR
jgi:hypothetical protein